MVQVRSQMHPNAVNRPRDPMGDKNSADQEVEENSDREHDEIENHVLIEPGQGRLQEIP